MTSPEGRNKNSKRLGDNQIKDRQGAGFLKEDGPEKSWSERARGEPVSEAPGGAGGQEASGRILR